jgi:hypothetical protein
VLTDVNMTTLKPGDHVVITDWCPEKNPPYYRVRVTNGDANSGVWAVMPDDLEATKPRGWRLYVRLDEGAYHITDHAFVTQDGSPNDLHVALATWLYRHGKVSSQIVEMIGPHQTAPPHVEPDHIYHHRVLPKPNLVPA